jgi:hypothetical protein
MSNSTLPYSAQKGALTDPSQKTMHMQEQDFVREEQQHLQTLQALDTLQFSPRPSTLVTIFDYAHETNKER